MEVVAALALAALVAWAVSRPLRRGGEADLAGADRRAELEAAKEAKYAEIRDAELDHRMGKVTEGDWRRTDRELRAQAVELLRELDGLEGREGETSGRDE
jgi:hypothetical protein